MGTSKWERLNCLGTSVGIHGDSTEKCSIRKVLKELLRATTLDTCLSRLTFRVGVTRKANKRPQFNAHIMLGEQELESERALSYIQIFEKLY